MAVPFYDNLEAMPIDGLSCLVEVERTYGLDWDRFDDHVDRPSVANPRQTVRRSIRHGLHDGASHYGEMCLMLKLWRASAEQRP